MNFRLILDFVDRYFISFALITFILFTWLLVTLVIESNTRNDSCKKLGGIMLSTTDGHVCGRVEVINLGKLP